MWPKVFHKGLPAGWDFPFSWDNPVVNITSQVHNRTDNTTRNVTHKGYQWLYPSEPRCPNGTAGCGVDPANTTFEDFDIADDALALLRNASAVAKSSRNGTRPFFLAVGFRKPHLQWRVPLRFWNRYSAANTSVAKHQVYPRFAPSLGYHQPVDDFVAAFNDTVYIYISNPVGVRVDRLNLYCGRESHE